MRFMPASRAAAATPTLQPASKAAAVPAAPGRKPGARAASRPADSYHHGDLRAALLRAAGELLAERGIEGFTLRECARRAGVSHGAPAHHFGDAAGMLTAYAAQGYERMTALMRDYQAKAGADHGSHLKAAGLAYIDFAVANRAQFQLMFRSDRINPDDAEFAAAAQAAFEALAGAARDAAPRASADATQISDRMLLAWSMVHGFATLVLEGQLAHHYGKQGPRQFARTVGERLVALLRPALGDARGEGA
jgi:AcrR family transcriptional regulator